MAVRAEHRQVCRPVIAPITVNVLEFQWNATGRGIPLAPATAGASLPKKVDYIAANPRDRAGLRRVLPIEEKLKPPTLLEQHLTLQRTIDRDGSLTVASAAVLTDAAWFLRIHDPIVTTQCANSMALETARYGDVAQEISRRHNIERQITRDGLHRPSCCRFRSRTARAARSPRDSSRSCA